MIAVKLQARYFLAAVAGVGMALPAFAQEPAKLKKDLPATPVAAAPAAKNQELADMIAMKLRKDPSLKNANIDIMVQGGMVELSGNVADSKTREHAQKIVMSAPGVVKVKDKITVGAIQRVSATNQDVLPQAAAPAPMPVPAGQGMVGNGMVGNGEPYGMIPGGVAPGGMGGGQEMMGTPPLPSYSWPTYAPYNNLSRVAYPEAYPACAWPFIGPFYPFPRVPPGWRSVKLEWEDGHWWFSKTATKYDWWRVRYW
jgi:BON domain